MNRIYKNIPVEEEKPPKSKLIIEDVCKVRSRHNLPCEGCLYYKRCRRERVKQ